MPAIEDCLAEVMTIPGAVDAMLVDTTSGMVVTTAGAGPPGGVQQSAAALGEALRATMDGLALVTSRATVRVNDVIVTTDHGDHLLKPVETGFDGPLLIYLRLDRGRSNIALARHRLGAVSARLVTP